MNTTGSVGMCYGSLGNYVTPKLIDLKQQQLIISHDSVRWQFGLSSVGWSCWSCCGHSCGCNDLMARLKWNVYDGLTHKFGTLVLLSLFTWSLILQESSSLFLLWLRELSKRRRVEATSSWRLSLELLQLSFHRIDWFKQVRRHLRVNGWGVDPRSRREELQCIWPF